MTLERCRFALGYGLATLAMLAAPSVAGQSARASIQGRLIERGTTTPIAGASVVLVGTGGPTTSDSAGRFAYGNLASGKHRLEVRAVGFVVGEWEVRLDAGEDLHYDFELDVLSYEVAGVSVTGRQADFDRRRARGIGFFFTRDEIERRHPLSLSDLLRGVPGVETTCGRGSCSIRMSRAPRACRPEYYLDGFPASFSVGPDFPVTSVYGIEVYRTASETPIEYRRPELRCGVILIWSGDKP